MGQLIDADKVVAMLRQESSQWKSVAFTMETVVAKLHYEGISMGYKAAAEDVEKMMKEQAAGNVPADSSE